ncbi:MAG TPA: ArsA family ATPase [Nannocystaceae bacterium]|nr:ArsA family ATPase [Nannocystaceae bacterium]
MTDGVRRSALRPFSTVLDELATRRFVIVSGKGGVGRTTISALLGSAFAARGRRVLVATTGHDDRLAWMLGASALGESPARVGERLYIQRLAPQNCIREYGALVLRSTRLSSVVFDNRVVAPLLRAVPGLDEFAVLGKAWHEAFRAGQFDTVVFDGPATGHLLYTLGVPRAILGTISPGPLTREAEQMQANFEDAASTSALLVGLPETWPLTELGELGAALRDRIGIRIGAVFVNGLWPADLPPPAGDADVPDAIATIDRVCAIGRRHHHEVDHWAQSEAAARCGADAMVLVPWRFGGVADVATLQGLQDPAATQGGAG